MVFSHPGIAWTPGAAIRLTWRPIRPPCRGRSPAWTPGTPSYPSRQGLHLNWSTDVFFSFFGDQLVDIPFWMVFLRVYFTIYKLTSDTSHDDLQWILVPKNHDQRYHPKHSEPSRSLLRPPTCHPQSCSSIGCPFWVPPSGRLKVANFAGTVKK
jgi:hypothetical protein